MSHPIITISGTPGSGKSTIAKALVSEFKATRFYAGATMRQIAKERGINLAELQKHMATDPKIDVEVDEKTAAEAKKVAKNNIVVVEGRTQFLFLPESIKIFIKVDLEEGAKRIWHSMQKEENRKKRNEAEVGSLEELIEVNKARRENDITRYQKYYNIDYTDESQYDFVLDTTPINAQQAIAKTLEFIKDKLK